MIKSYSSLQTKCYKFSRQQDTEEIELVSKVRKALVKVTDAIRLMEWIFQRSGGAGPVKVELTGPEEPGKN